MRDKVEAKLAQAQAQIPEWQKRLAEAQQQVASAQEQVIRWDSVRQTCEDLLAEKGEVGNEEDSAD
jgi:multidrug resistance efflux pump